MLSGQNIILFCNNAMDLINAINASVIFFVYLFSPTGNFKSRCDQVVNKKKMGKICIFLVQVRLSSCLALVMSSYDYVFKYALFGGHSSSWQINPHYHIFRIHYSATVHNKSMIIIYETHHLRKQNRISENVTSWKQAAIKTKNYLK